jgi:uncharacterized membrane protein YfcA
MAEKAMVKKPDYWFPAKRHGWGWGLPVKWQGWLVLTPFVAVVAIAGVRLPPTQDAPAFVAILLVATLVLAAVCWWKGEPPRWRQAEDRP